MTQDIQTSGDLQFTIPLVNQSETEQIAQKLSALLQAGDVIALWGDLGAGKSTLSRAMVQSLCGSDTNVPSPTFTLVQTYDVGEFDLWHMDMYRLNEPDEAYELGIEDAFATSCCLIEWPDKLGYILPQKRIDIVMAYDTDNGDNARTISLYCIANDAVRFKGLLG